MSSRYLIRKTAADLWMVWNRETKGVVINGSNRLTNLTRNAAETMLAILQAQENSGVEIKTEWQIIYSGGLLIDCKDEADARQLAKVLLKRGVGVTVRRLSNGQVADEWTGDALRVRLNQS